MESELARLSRAFLNALDRRGPASLELVAASRYFDRLMDNSKVCDFWHAISLAVLKSFTTWRGSSSDSRDDRRQRRVSRTDSSSFQQLGSAWVPIE
ncbi:hypothetical protein EOA91_04365 [Mesorhizobium sp. M1A.F.Ca.IN.022.04.1.1]|nr:hypothetical protein EOA91_04365 [Mesorhizobium sp. M1A.F.Ca.IN.022.04.1.1]